MITPSTRLEVRKSHRATDELLPLVAIDDAALLPPDPLELIPRAFPPRDVALAKNALNKIRDPIAVDAVSLIILVEFVREPPDAVDVEGREGPQRQRELLER